MIIDALLQLVGDITVYSRDLLNLTLILAQTFRTLDSLPNKFVETLAKYSNPSSHDNHYTSRLVIIYVGIQMNILD